jgi:hypothetical protein
VSDFAWRMLLGIAYMAVTARALWNMRCTASVNKRLVAGTIASVAFIWSALWFYYAVLYGWEPLYEPGHISWGVWLGRVVHIPQLAGMVFIMRLQCKNGERTL